MILLLVESPTKAKTLKAFLGNNYRVLASMGHIRDLPKSELGIDVEKNFKPKYVIPTKARKVVNELKKEIEKADSAILASDEDREGEAIAWHLGEVLGLKNPKRIVFHEITKTAIKEALKNPRTIDMNLVDSQQTRRILDRLVGYQLSPFLWKKVAKGLSAGRVQSVAVRLVVEREREIQNFKPQEYWTVEVLLQKTNPPAGGQKEFTALLVKKVENKEQADKILNDLEGAEYKVETVEKKQTKKNPFPPFTTSSLQQTAWQRFHFPAKMTMQSAQRLYENGFISYHRTDSFNLSESSLIAAKKFIAENFGNNYWAGSFVKYKTKGKAQEAHEAIRPTTAGRTPDSLKGMDLRQLKLYALIWQRFIACQMAPARFDSTVVEIKAQNQKSKTPNYTFRTSGQILKFDGFLKVYPVKFEEADLPELKEGESLEFIKLNPLQHFTEPPPRYNEASLIKTLEKYGIGRPSTYAPILSTIQERNYVAKNEQRKFFPTEIGIIVNDILTENFPKIVDVDFTAKMEKELDEIAEGKDTLVKTCNDFYRPFAKNLKEKYEKVEKKVVAKETDKTCPKCGSPILERLGRFGRFYACSKFPECKYAESLEKKEEKLGIKCPKCREGEIIAKKTRRGKIFYGCSLFPKCDFALWQKPVNEFCKKCGSIMIEVRKEKITCSNKECGQ